MRQHRAYRAVRSVIDNLDRHAATRAASAMAFDAFLSLIPLLAFAGYVLSKLHQSSALVLRPLMQSAPPAVARLVTEEFLRLAASAAVAPISLTGFLWMSSSGVATAMGVFETIYNTRERPWYVRRAIAAGCVLASLAVIPIVAGLGLLLGGLSGSLGARAIAVTLPGGLVVFFVAAFFHIAIRRPNIERRRVLPGAILTVVLWALVSALFSLYVTTLARYTTFYGNLATVAIFLFWLWLLALALLVGGELNARLERERAGVTSVRPSAAPSARPRALPPSPAVPHGVDLALGPPPEAEDSVAAAPATAAPDAAEPRP